MQNIKNWGSTDELFGELNKTCDYLVMRNFEQMNEKDFFIKGHEDIDFLCSDPYKMSSVLCAWPRKFFNRKVQNYILLDGNKIKIDIRYVGDNYYDRKWETDMLCNRVFNDLGFYTMNHADYFYSLVYHAILQKKELSPEYYVKLVQMAKSLGISACDEASLVKVLEEWMLKNRYDFVYPSDGTVPNRFTVLSSIPKGKIFWQVRALDGKVKQFIYSCFLQ